MFSIDSLKTQAFGAYRNGSYAQARLLFQQAAYESKRHGEQVRWYELTAWACHCNRLLGHLPEAMAMLLELRKAEPGIPDRSSRDTCYTRLEYQSVLLDYSPELDKLQDNLEELVEFVEEGLISASDFDHLTANLEYVRGNWEEALLKFEKSWTDYDSNSDSNVKVRELRAQYIVLCALQLGDLPSVQNWIKIHIDAETKHGNRQKAVNAALSLELALLDPNMTEEARAVFADQKLRSFNDAVVSVNDTYLQHQADLLRARVSLIKSDGNDPLIPSHPAQIPLRKHFDNRWHIHQHFERRLFMVDFRLASLRYAAGMEPAEDAYYTHPQQIPEDGIVPVDPEDFARRLAKARAVSSRAHAYACKLDGWFKCDWRQEKIAGRSERIEQIARAVNPGGVV